MFFRPFGALYGFDAGERINVSDAIKKHGGVIPMNQTPSVTCVMPTRGRRAYVPRAIRYFQRQSYRNRTLLILDDGPDPVEDLIPADSRIRYEYLPRRYSLGAKRNLACRRSEGALLLHWDDDDWIASWRIEYQVEQMIKHGAEISGLSRLYFYAPEQRQAWEYRYPGGGKPWVAGGTLCYTREFWERHPFPEISNGEDTRFVWGKGNHHLLALPETSFYVALIHRGNTSAKRPRSNRWTAVTPGKIQEIMGPDFPQYDRNGTPAAATSPRMQLQQDSPKKKQETAVRQNTPEYSILMVVHNTLEMVRVATLRTLRYSAGEAVEFIVVDNASTDGAQEWLAMLERRRDVRVIRNEQNAGHGPALEQARQAARGKYLVTLDSDAFPVAVGWLPQLKERLSGPVKATGILHHRNYIHPSCLLIERQMMEEHQLTFLDRKDRPSGPDVAEPISQYLLDQGFEISGLSRTGSRRRGSRSEPVYLGSVYDGLVYHQWYTTREQIAGARQVDDVPPEAIDHSLEELFSEYRAEPRELTVILGVRADPGDPRRARNALAALQSLNRQDLPRWRYRIMVVEQDSAPRLRDRLSPLADHYLFVENPGPYNRGWGFNVGVAQSPGKDRVVCLVDADLVVPEDFLSTGLAQVTKDHRAVLPYTEILYLDARSSRKLLKRQEEAESWGGSALGGKTFTSSQGGCVFVDREFYRDIGGFDERFRGWGYEDREFYRRVSHETTVPRIEHRLLHLHHQRPAMTGQGPARNKRLLETSRDTGAPEDSFGDPRKYRRKSVRTPASNERGVLGQRDGEMWHRWSRAAIQRILRDERRRASTRSLRFQTAALAGRIGDSLLDVGCGPGPLWLHRRSCLPGVHITGVDATKEMVRAAKTNFPGVEVRHADAADLPFEDGAFDVVLLRHLLEHLPRKRMEAALQEACRVASSTVICGWHLPPVPEATSQTRLAPGGFYENRWAESSLERVIVSAAWEVQARCELRAGAGEQDTLWLLGPGNGQSTAAEDAVRPPLKFSLIMPTYRRPHTLFRTVRSVLNQTYPRWELILVDNAGENAYQFTDPRISVYEHPERTGASYARNIGLRYATGDLICFFDDDDDMYPEYLERFAEAFTGHPEAKMVRCGMHLSDEAVNYSYATPECCIRREFVSGDWQGYSVQHDQIYFKNIIRRQEWSEQAGDILSLRDVLCRANSDPLGGLRGGRL